MKTIAGKKALVTGAASGIGRAIACALAAEGADLCLLDIDTTGLYALASQLRSRGARVVAWRCDLTDRANLDGRLNDLVNQWGGVDILVNNAGTAFLGPLASMDDEQWERLMAVNLLAPAHIVRRLLESLKERDEAQIVNIASIAGLVGFKRIAAYCLTKFGMVGFSEALRSELARDGIGVTVVCPGFVSTNLFQATMTGSNKKAPAPHPWLCVSPETVAQSVIKAIRKNRPIVVPSPLVHALWLMKRLSPHLMLALLGGYRGRKRPRPEPAIARHDEIEHETPELAGVFHREA